MSAGHQSKSYRQRGLVVPASQTVLEVGRFAIENEGRLNFKVDAYLGKVVGAPTLTLQDTNGHELWSTVKTSAALSASTNTTVTPNFTTATFTAAAHGYTNGEQLAFNTTGAMPTGLDALTRYFAQNVTTNTFQVSPFQPASSLPSSFSDNGTGTLTTTPVSLTTIAVNVEVAGDQAVMPLRPNGRLTATTAGGESVQVMDIRIGQCY